MPKKNYGQCLICGAPSIGINFGVATCMPCKAFFRRNATKLGTREFICANDGDCIISCEYRRTCNCCRMAKCFRVGMKRSFILTDEERDARNKLVTTNRLKRGQVVKIKYPEWMQPPALIQAPSSTLQHISPTEHTLLNNIFNAYENICITAKNTRFQSFPLVQHTSVHDFFNEICLAFPVFIEYFKVLPEFNIISVDDRMRLLKNHFCIMININQMIMHPETSSDLIITWTNIFGVDVTERLLKRNQVLESYLYDFIVLKLLLIILVLSSSSSRNIDHFDLDLICDDSLSIFAAQNIYVDLLWKYILSRSSNEKDAVKFFNRLMMCILYIQNVDMYIDGYVDGLQHEVQQLEPLIQNMWPKKEHEENITDISMIQDISA